MKKGLTSSKLGKYAVLVGSIASATLAVKGEAAIIINEVYGGGGSSSTGASYSADFFELYNTATSAVDLANYSFQYASATGAFPTSATAATSQQVTLSGSIPALGYFLISGATAATFGGAALPAADSTSPLAASATAGKVRLLDGTGLVLDLVAYGTTATGGEGSPAISPSNTTTSISRAVLGVDTNNNSADFITGSPSPMSSVPEPTSLGLVAAGASLLIGRRRRKK